MLVSSRAPQTCVGSSLWKLPGNSCVSTRRVSRSASGAAQGSGRRPMVDEGVRKSWLQAYSAPLNIEDKGSSPRFQIAYLCHKAWSVRRTILDNAKFETVDSHFDTIGVERGPPVY
jgi:hypothetical protein